MNNNCHNTTPQTRRRVLLAASATLAIAGVLGGMSAHAQGNPRAIAPAEWEKVLAAARKEGKVVVYTTTAPAAHARLKADFDKAYPGIVLEPVRLIGAQINVKLEQERQIANVDGGDTMITSE
ncbi:MAG: hypothetical protein FJY55_07280, partial [Betaproteobacteria bacterium]|nr:hypothetical protein [Betaproteobacteria bacterium]